MAFQERRTCPSSDDKCWIRTNYGGYNKCILGSPSNGPGSVLANCVGYVWGRFLEIMRQSDPSITTCELPTCNAGDFLKYNTKYETGSEAKVGAVAVFAPCHVAIVESIDENGVCTLSESGWGGPMFRYGNTISKARGYNDHNWGHYTIKGFIYNPYGGDSGRNIAQVFVNEALKHVGEHAADWTWPTYGMYNIEWCAAFVSAVAKTVGISNRCIYYSASASGVPMMSVRNNMGEFHKGPAQGQQYTPVMGDLILFRYGTSRSSPEFSANHIGIVVDVSDSIVNTVEGNTGTYNKNTSTVMRHSYALSATSISGYYHPNWSLVGSIDPASGKVIGDLYTTHTTRKDATVREYGYLDLSMKPSMIPSKVSLSAINYTGMLAALFKKYAAAAGYTDGSGDGQIISDDQLDSKCRTVVEHLVSKGLNPAAACGIAGNIFHESGFNTAAVGDYGTSFGICQWHNARGAAMKSHVGPSWSTNLTGQLDYLWYELTTSYKNSTLSKIQQVSNDLSGCKQAADIFVRKFEVPSNVDVKSLERQSTAASYFNSIVVR